MNLHEPQCHDECIPGECPRDRPHKIDWLNVTVWLVAIPAIVAAEMALIVWLIS